MPGTLPPTSSFLHLGNGATLWHYSTYQPNGGGAGAATSCKTLNTEELASRETRTGAFAGEEIQV